MEKKAAPKKEKFILKATVLLIIKHPEDNKWIVINETKNRGLSCPGGHVHPPDNFYQTAAKVAQKEAGIDIEIKGLLRMEHYTWKDTKNMKMRIIFYCQPKNPK
mmetsp:Transcript_31188/g.28371  ORF Transcript_31188/g.28371 Transcript_31188/m.28371 type:complete len:104 (+) Transcript_31188:57-368(+)